MLTFKSKKQIKDIFTSLLSQNTNHSHIKDLRKQFLSFTEIDNELEEKQLDTLQESLAELEEKKDDLTYKIAFLRKNLVKQLRNEFENVNYCDKIEKMNVRFDVQVVCENKPNEISGEESSVNEGSVIDELECLLTKEKNVVKKKEDAYQIAKKYFCNLH